MWARPGPACRRRLGRPAGARRSGERVRRATGNARTGPAAVRTSAAAGRPPSHRPGATRCDRWHAPSHHCAHAAAGSVAQGSTGTDAAGRSAGPSTASSGPRLRLQVGRQVIQGPSGPGVKRASSIGMYSSSSERWVEHVGEPEQVAPQRKDPEAIGMAGSPVARTDWCDMYASPGAPSHRMFGSVGRPRAVEHRPPPLPPCSRIRRLVNPDLRAAPAAYKLAGVEQLAVEAMGQVSGLHVAPQQIVVLARRPWSREASFSPPWLSSEPAPEARCPGRGSLPRRAQVSPAPSRSASSLASWAAAAEFQPCRTPVAAADRPVRLLIPVPGSYQPGMYASAVRWPAPVPPTSRSSQPPSPRSVALPSRNASIRARLGAHHRHRAPGVPRPLATPPLMLDAALGLSVRYTFPHVETARRKAELVQPGDERTSVRFALGHEPQQELGPAARCELLFRTDPARWESWWCEGSPS